MPHTFNHPDTNAFHDPAMVPPGMSEQRANDLAGQYAAATNSSAEDIEQIKARLLQGEEGAMLRELRQKMQADMRNSAMELLNSQLAEEDAEGAMATAASIDEIKPPPDALLLETEVLEANLLDRSLDETEVTLQGEEAFDPLAELHKINTRALALHNVGMQIADIVQENYPHWYNFVSDIAGFLVPLHYTVNNARDLEGMLVPGTMNKEISDSLWSGDDQEFANELENIVFHAKQSFPNNPLKQVVSIIDAITTSTGDDQLAQRVLAVKNLYDEDGNPIPNAFAAIFDGTGIDILFADEGFQNLLDSVITDVAGWGGALLGAVSLAAKLFGRKAGAAAATGSILHATNTGQPSRVLLYSTQLRRDDTLVDSASDIARDLDQVYETAHAGLNRRVLHTADPSQVDIDRAVAKTVKPFMDERALSHVKYVSSNNVLELEVYEQTTKGTPFASIKSAEQAANRRGLSAFEVVENPNGAGFYIKRRQGVNQEGWFKDIHDDLTGNQNIMQRLAGNTTELGRYVLSPGATSTEATRSASTAANLERGKLLKIFDTLYQPLSKLSKSDQNKLGSAIDYGKKLPNARTGQEGVWLSEPELNAVYRKLHGRPATKAERLGYYAYKAGSDFNWHLMNEKIWRDLRRAGFDTWNIENTRISTIIGQRVSDPTKISADAKVLLPDGTIVTKSEFVSSHLDPDFAMVRAHGFADIDGKRFTHVYSPANKTTTGGLQRNILNYTEGGTRNYEGRWFTKQSRGKGANPITSGVFRSESAAKEFAAKMNKVLGIYRAYKASPKNFKLSEVNREIEAIDDRFSIGELDKLVQEGKLNPKEDVITRFDRQAMPDEVEEFRGTVTPQHYQRNGRLYYSERGEHLLEDDLSAPLINPFDALARQTGHAVNASAYSDLLFTEAMSWMVTYGKYTSSPKGVSYPSLLDIFLNGEIKKGTDAKVRNAAESQRLYIKRSLHQPTGSSAKINEVYDNLSQSIARATGDKKYVPSSVRSGRILTDSDAVNFLKKMAYNLHLGMLSLGQLPLQGSAAVTALTMHPIYGAAAFKDYAFIRAAVISGGNNKVSRLIASRAGKYLGHTNQEFMDIVEDYHKLGLHHIGKTDAYLDSAAQGMRIGGRAQDWVSTAIAVGRIPVYEGERIARIISYGIARRMALDLVEKGRFRAKSPQYYRWMSGKTNDLQLGMMSGQETWWQREKLTALGTQFLQYPFKVTEVFLGLNRALNTQEKVGLIAGQTLLWGSYGIPFGPQLADKARDAYESITGEVMNDEAYKGIMLGMVDYIIQVASEEDSAAGAVFGTGDLLYGVVKDVMRGEFLGTLGGVVAQDLSKLKGVTKNLWRLYGATVMNEAETVGIQDFSVQAMTELGTVLKSTSNFTKAWYLRQYGKMLSSKGDHVVDMDSSYSPLLTILGVPSWGELQVWRGYDKTTARITMIREVADLIAKKEIEAYAAIEDGDWEKHAVVVTTIGGLIEGLEPEDRTLAVDLAHRSVSSDQISRIVRDRAALEYKAEANK